MSKILQFPSPEDKRASLDALDRLRADVEKGLTIGYAIIEIREDDTKQKSARTLAAVGELCAFDLLCLVGTLEHLKRWLQECLEGDE